MASLRALAASRKHKGKNLSLDLRGQRLLQEAFAKTPFFRPARTERSTVDRFTSKPGCFSYRKLA